MKARWLIPVSVLLGIVLLSAAGVTTLREAQRGASPTSRDGGAHQVVLKVVRVGTFTKKKKIMANYLVSGAGTSAVNGTYVEAGTFNSHPYYVKGGIYMFFVPSAQWAIGTALGGGPATKYYAALGSPTATPPASGWDFLEGSPPNPTVTPVSSYATPPAPKITGIIDSGFFTLHNTLPWDASWDTDHRPTLSSADYPLQFPMNDTDTTFQVNPFDENVARTYWFEIEGSGGVIGPETKIVTCPRIDINRWDVVVPSSLPSGGHNLKLQTNHFDAAYHEDEWVDIATGLVADQRIRIANMIPRLAMVRYYCEFAGGYGGQGGSDEFSVSEAVQWPGKATGGFSDF